MTSTQPKLVMGGAVAVAVVAYGVAFVTAEVAAAWVTPMALAALLWGAGVVWVWRGLGAAALVLTVGTAAAGVLVGLSPLLMVLVVVMALAAWQLHHMAWRVEGAATVEGGGLLLRRTLTRLGVFAALSMGLAALPLLIELEVTFLLGVALALLSLFVLSRVVRTLSEKEDPA